MKKDENVASKEGWAGEEVQLVPVNCSVPTTIVQIKQECMVEGIKRKNEEMFGGGEY
jgi:hypothetical protein